MAYAANRGHATKRGMMKTAFGSLAIERRKSVGVFEVFRFSVERKQRQVLLLSESLFRNESMIVGETPRAAIGLYENARSRARTPGLRPCAISRVAHGTKRIGDRDSTI